MEVVSKDEIRLDPERVEVIYNLRDEWGRRLVKSVILNRPQRAWYPGCSPDRKCVHGNEWGGKCPHCDGFNG